MVKQKFLNGAGVLTLWEAIKSIVSDINTTIINNELVTATALTDLDTRIDNLEGLATPVISKTYSELKTLRNNNNLVPGRQYRITDYVTTTAQENTTSAEHQFDIIVTANSTNTFSEVARAIHHAGDTYFANSKLDAWKIWYCFDNDSDRFLWADTTNGKGVIYRMIDEWNNDCPYDFKNIMFVRYELNAPDEYTAEDYNNNWITALAQNVRTMFGNQHLAYIWAGTNNSIKYWDGDTKELYSLHTGTTRSFYTFSNIIDNVVSDKSITNVCYSNTINEHYEIPKYRLNNIVFFNTSIDSMCYFNSFGNFCYDNSFGNLCGSNSFGNLCNSNTFGDFCYSNTFSDSCNSNNFGNFCHGNRFNNECNSNTFCNRCYNNSFGNGCKFNIFNDVCHSNSFGNSCTYNELGFSCNSNSFGNSCRSNSFGNYCYYNSFRNDCCYNSFRVSGDNTSSLISYCRYNAFDDGCSYNIFYSANTNDSTYLENYHINRGVKGTTSTPMLIDAQYLNAENVCNVYKKGDVAVVAYIQY